MRWRHGVLIAVLMTPGAAVGDADGPARLLTYRNGRLSARLDRVPLEQVLTALSQATGAAIHGRPLAPWEVSAHFDAEPLQEALDRLLDQSFILRYGADGRLLSVNLLAAPLPRVAKRGRAPASPAALSVMVAEHDPITVSGRLAKALHAGRVRLPVLLEAAVHDEDASVRAAALAEALATVEADGTLRVLLLSTLRGMSDDTLTTLVRAWTGNRADELVTQVAQRSRDGYLRERAASVLARLRLAATAARGTGGPLSRARG
jgi:hypothetical protein